MNFIIKSSYAIDCIQDRLDFKTWVGYPQFIKIKGLGRIALISLVLGSILSVHLVFLFLAIAEHYGFSPSMFLNNLPETRIKLIIQWLIFVVLMCIFHLSEFFVTAIFNPSVVDASSFVVNHSKPYTVAMLVAVAEFWMKFGLFPSVNSSYGLFIGIMWVFGGQFIRSTAMITCGESFNHIIQHSKKDTHKLVTSGIYSYLRHPSYTGFFYWSVGTQLILGNCISTILFAGASWYFFHRRIPFEEQTLLRLFPDEYPSYMQRTRIGIPFIKSIDKKTS